MIWPAWNIPQAALMKLMILILETVISGNLSSFLKGVKPLVLYDVDRGVVMEPMQGKLASFQFDFGYTELFCVSVVTSGLVSVLLGTLSCSIKQIEVTYVFDWENAIALATMQGNRASCRGEGKVSWVFSSCGRNLGYILELQRGCPFETGVCSVKSGHLSRYEGHLRNIN